MGAKSGWDAPEASVRSVAELLVRAAPNWGEVYQSRKRQLSDDANLTQLSVVQPEARVFSASSSCEPCEPVLLPEKVVPAMHVSSSWTVDQSAGKDELLSFLSSYSERAEGAGVEPERGARVVLASPAQTILSAGRNEPPGPSTTLVSERVVVATKRQPSLRPSFSSHSLPSYSERVDGAHQVGFEPGRRAQVVFSSPVHATLSASWKELPRPSSICFPEPRVVVGRRKVRKDQEECRRQLKESQLFARLASVLGRMQPMDTTAKEHVSPEATIEWAIHAIKDASSALSASGKARCLPMNARPASPSRKHHLEPLPADFDSPDAGELSSEPRRTHACATTAVSHPEPARTTTPMRDEGDEILMCLYEYAQHSPRLTPEGFEPREDTGVHLRERGSAPAKIDGLPLLACLPYNSSWEC